ncbi:cation transporter [Paenibacillus sp. J5C_2022]|uniref:cation transporter n=1 Tax=Paenibacillus sp. J5C2022 TaxID=2977129 RepID=UPI0021D05F11|nr:cation transporter [Paenibacillus sp. J5C2022]MCU6712764.1 cation transporter [Paenibacillus sp. J5C2022]
MTTEVLHVEGMSCGHCVNSIQQALADIGVNGEVDLAGKKVKVEYDSSKQSLDKIKETIEEQGYDIA